MIYETYTVHKEKNIIPSFASCYFKEASSKSLKHPSIDKSKNDTYPRYIVTYSNY